MKVLTELDNGHPPEESDLDVVLREASIVSEEKVSKPAFCKAIHMWYAICDERLKNQLHAGQHPESTATTGAGSACCAIA
jgi:hypothetical protein